MNTTLTIDKGGHAQRINPGDSLELESSEDHLILRPATGKGRIYKKQGVLGL
jgi:hypothetical protein